MRTSSAKLALSFFHKLRRHEATGDVLGLYVIQAVQVLLPIAMIPYLARRLGPSEWGTVAFFQAVAMYLSLTLEFGFGLSATRSIARHRDSLPFRADSISSVTGAKVVILITAGLFLGIFYSSNHILRDHPLYFIAALAWGTAQGFNMVWYFQGLGQMRKLAIVEVSNRILAAALMVALIRSPTDGWRVLLFNACGASFATILSTTMACKNLNVRPPSWPAAIRGLREGFGLFLFRSAVSLYTMGNSFILGLFCPAVFVGYYAGAERISKGILSCVAPLNQTLYAQINKAFAESEEKGERLARVSGLLLTAAGLVLGMIVFVFAPFLVKVMLGKGFEPCVPAVRIMSALPPLICLATALGANWMLPLHFDKQFTSITLAAGILNIILASLLAPNLRHIGMCIAVTATEFFVCASFLIYLTKKGKHPFPWKNGQQPVLKTSAEQEESALTR